MREPISSATCPREGVRPIWLRPFSPGARAPPGAHVSEATALWLQTMVAQGAGDTAELQGNIRAADGYFAADHTSLRGAKIG